LRDGIVGELLKLIDFTKPDDAQQGPGPRGQVLGGDCATGNFRQDIDFDPEARTVSTSICHGFIPRRLAVLPRLLHHYNGIRSDNSPDSERSIL
jgi:hypothetical protein